MRDLNGAVIGRYVVRERIGVGGMGIVYRAEQQSLGREVALKVLSFTSAEQDEFVQRFENEARILGRLDHPNVLPVYDFGSQDGLAYLAMPFVRGGTLKDRLDHGALDLPTAWRYASELADGLHHAHEAGLVHRDVKPTNVLLHADGRVLLSDFGLARSGSVQSALTAYGIPLGTPGYMSPEQAMGRPVDRRADVFSLGVVIFQMLTGHLPFAGDSALSIMMATMDGRRAARRDYNPSLPIGVDDVLADCLSAERDDRPQTAMDLLQRFRTAMRGQRPSAAWSVDAGSAVPAQSQRVPSMSGTLTAPTDGLSTSSLYAASSPVSANLAVEERTIVQRPTTPPRPGPALQALEHMGLPRRHATASTAMNAYVATATRAARDVAGHQWPLVAQLAGLDDQIVDHLPDDHEHGAPVDLVARIDDAFQQVFGGSAPESLRAWGRLTTERSHVLPLATAELRSLTLRFSQNRRVVSLLKNYTAAMDAVRGESLNLWKQLDDRQYWLVQYSNLNALDRRAAVKACYFCTASFETLLRAAGLANGWLVEEIECGSVTGTGDCVFALRSTRGRQP